jgi:hypothetical protein
MNFLEQKELREFDVFLSTKAMEISPSTTQTIFAKNKNVQSQFKAVIFAKLLTIHIVVSFLSLAICHQFGMNPFNSSISLSDYFMHFGHSVCMLFCGFLFIGSSLLMARFILHKYEFVIIRNSFALQIFALCSLSIGVFMAAGAHMSLSIALFWIAGAYIGSTLPVFIPDIRYSH